MNDTVFITGVSGFVGGHLQRHLSAAGWRVGGCGHQQACLTDKQALQRHFSAAASLVHLAFPTDRNWRQQHPDQAAQVAGPGTANVIMLAAQHGARHLVLASSAKVYGPPRQLPTPENHPLQPAEELGQLKLLQELTAQQLCAQLGMALTILRIFNVYGPGMPEHFFVGKLLAAARDDTPLELGELEHRRDWLYVDDLCRALELVLRSKPAPGQLRILNVGSGRAAAVREILDILQASCDVPVRYRQLASLKRPREWPEERADCTRLHELGWRPSIDLERGFAICWQAMRQA